MIATSSHSIAGEAMSAHFYEHSAGADPRGGLRVLKHPHKLPKIYYLLFNIVTYSLNSDITS